MKTFDKKYLEAIDRLPMNEEICRSMLKLIGNNKTKVKLDKDIKDSYYVFVVDTIYLSDNKKSNESMYRLSMLAHECIHSIQNKVLQFFNFILTNLEIIMFLLTLFMIYKDKSILIYGYLTINILSLIFRLILEIHAVVKSLYLSEKYLETIVNKEDTKSILKVYRNKIILFLPIFIVSLLYGKVLRLIIILILR